MTPEEAAMRREAEVPPPAVGDDPEPPKPHGWSLGLRVVSTTSRTSSYSARSAMN